MLAVPTPIGEVAGLAERVVVDGELDRTAAELATRLSNGPTRAYVAAKSLFRAYESGGVGTADRLLADVTAGLFDTEDSRAALAAAADLREGRADGQPSAQGPAAFPVAFRGR